ncbi:hypothetical protein [Streptomyces sp. NPDC058613]|uniref:hypothetical protein n=1 Tax=unclassified Streptomyces TaxID=2593676 RepID=UPI00365C6FBA
MTTVYAVRCELCRGLSPAAEGQDGALLPLLEAEADHVREAHPGGLPGHGPGPGADHSGFRACRP